MKLVEHHREAPRLRHWLPRPWAEVEVTGDAGDDPSTWTNRLHCGIEIIGDQSEAFASTSWQFDLSRRECLFFDWLLPDSNWWSRKPAMRPRGAIFTRLWPLRRR